MNIVQLHTGAYLIPDPTLQHIGIFLALHSKRARLVASDGVHYRAKRNDWHEWETHVEKPTRFNKLDRCLKVCTKLNEHQELDQERWQPMLWVAPDAEYIINALPQLQQAGLELVGAYVGGDDHNSLEQEP